MNSTRRNCLRSGKAVVLSLSVVFSAHACRGQGDVTARDGSAGADLVCDDGTAVGGPCAPAPADADADAGEIVKIAFSLPAKIYDLNTAAWGLPAATLPAISCTGADTCCAAAAPLGLDCAALVCDVSTATCALSVTIEIPRLVDLKAEVPALAGIGARHPVDVTIGKITYDIGPNTMNEDLPAIQLLVARDGAATSADPSTRPFGVIRPTPASTTLVGQPLTLDPAGQAAFVAYVQDDVTPFELIARTTVTVPGGAPIPTGEATIAVTGQLAVRLGP